MDTVRHGDQILIDFGRFDYLLSGKNRQLGHESPGRATGVRVR